jgi:Lipocalin-like domain
MGATTPATAQEGSPLIGAWRLVSLQSIVDGSEPQNIFGLHPKGYIVFTLGGRMTAVITAEHRKGGVSDTEQLELHKSLIAYSGKYRIEGGDFVTIVDVSWNETWNGTEQRRHFTISGDKLVVEGDPRPDGLFPGKISFARVIFEREGKRARAFAR